MNTRSVVGLALGLLSASLVGASWAQDPPAVAPSGQTATSEVQRRLRLLRAWEITRALKLDGEAAGKLLSVFAKYDQQRQTLFKELRDSRRELTKLLRKKQPDQTALQSHVDTYMKSRIDLAQLSQQEFQDLRPILSPQQQAKYLLAKRSFEKKIQQMLRQVRKK